MNLTNSTSCRSAMANLEILLKSYNISEDRTQKLEESLFDNTFDPAVRMDLKGRSLKRDFLLFQIKQNFARRLRVHNIVMEVLDSENFDYTFQIQMDEKEGQDDSQMQWTFHSLATVKDGKIAKIKPLTGTAYINWFEDNIRIDMSERKAAKEDDDSKSVERRQEADHDTPPSTPSISTPSSFMRAIKTIVTIPDSPLLLTPRRDGRISPASFHSGESVKNRLFLPRLSCQKRPSSCQKRLSQTSDMTE